MAVKPFVDDMGEQQLNFGGGGGGGENGEKQLLSSLTSNKEIMAKI